MNRYLGIKNKIRLSGPGGCREKDLGARSFSQHLLMRNLCFPEISWSTELTSLRRSGLDRENGEAVVCGGGATASLEVINRGSGGQQKILTS